MATDFETDTQPSTSSLLSGIVQDARQLIVEQLTLFQVEIKNDLHRTVMAMIPLITGAVVMFVALLVLALGTVHLVCWLFPELPLWGGYAIVGGAIAVVGGALMFWAKTQFATFNPLPDTALKGLKENLQWKTKN